MMDTQSVGFIIIEVLVIILLITAVLSGILMVRILLSIRRIVRKAEETTSSLNEFLQVAGKRLGPIAGSALLSAIVKKLRKHKFEEE